MTGAAISTIDTPDPLSLRSAKGRRVLAPILLAAVQNPLNSSMLVTALVPIAQTYHVAVAATGWLLVGLYLASAVGQATMGKLVDLFGARRIMLYGLTMVAIAGCIGTFAPTLGWLIAARVALGMGTSAAYPAAMAMLRQIAGENRPVPMYALSLLAIAAQVSVAFAPSIGGFFVEYLGWRATLAFNIPSALVTIVLVLLWLPRDLRAPAPFSLRVLVRTLDLPGIALFTILMSALVALTTNVPIPSLVTAGVLVLAAVLFVLRERRASAPFVDLRLISTNRGLAITYLRQAATMLTVYTVFYGFVQWWQQTSGISAVATGVFMLINSGTSIIAAAAAPRFSLRGGLLIGALFGVAGGVIVATITHVEPLVVSLAAVGLFGVLSGLNGVANQGVLYAQARAGEMGSAAGLYRTAQYIGATGSAGAMGLAYGQHASDAGFHLLGIMMVVLTVGLVLDALFDRTIPARRGAVA